MHIKTVNSIKVVCRVSVHIIVFMPPLYVYSHIKKMVTKVVIKNGIPNEAKNNTSSTLATKNNLKEAPRVLDKKKYTAPDL